MRYAGIHRMVLSSEVWTTEELPGTQHTWVTFEEDGRGWTLTPQEETDIIVGTESWNKV